MSTEDHSEPRGIVAERLPAIARDAVRSAFEPPQGQPRGTAHEVLGRRGGVFVTLRDSHGQLRGCIGTLTPKFQDVVEETRRMAREAAFHDSRFAPVSARELPSLRFEVSVVNTPETVPDPSMLDAARFGVVVSTADGRRGALLPAVEGIDTVAEQLAIARRKGAIGFNESVNIQRFTVEKYEEPDSPDVTPL